MKQLNSSIRKHIDKMRISLYNEDFYSEYKYSKRVHHNDMIFYGTEDKIARKLDLILQ